MLLTTNDDAINIFLASYCRHLNQELRIVSRVTHQRNVEALHRAGADLVLSYHSLGVEVVMSILKGRELIVLGEGVDLFRVPVPPSLHDVSLGESGIGARTGLIVIALRHADGTTHTSPPPSTTLPPDAELVFIGSTQQREAFAAEFG